MGRSSDFELRCSSKSPFPPHKGAKTSPRTPSFNLKIPLFVSFHPESLFPLPEPLLWIKRRHRSTYTNPMWKRAFSCRQRAFLQFYQLNTRANFPTFGAMKNTGFPRRFRGFARPQLKENQAVKTLEICSSTFSASGLLQLEY